MVPGQLFFLVGNWGSGKDSLLKEALLHWPEDLSLVKIPKRYITRPPHETEPFYSVTKKEFEELKENGIFCLTWHIYDLDYGVPYTIVEWLEKGEIVVVNVSRTIIPDAREQFPDLKVLFVEVPYEITLARIKNRGREAEDDPVFKARVDRARKNQTLPEADFIIENTAALEIGGEKLRNYLVQFAKKKY
jgi:ribose 1,5-bisphosphokinase